MSNPEAFGIAGKNMESFRGVRVHWGMDNDEQNLVNKFAEQFENLDQVAEHLEFMIEAGGCSTLEDLIEGNEYIDREPEAITGDRENEAYVRGYWVIDNAPEGTDRASLESDYKDQQADHPDSDYSLEDYITDCLREEGVGWVDDKGKFSFTFFGGESSMTPRLAPFIKSKK